MAQPPPYDPANKNQMPMPGSPPFPQQPQAYGAPPAPPQMVLVQTTARLPLAKSPTQYSCPNCRNQIVTKTNQSLKGSAVTTSAILCFLGCFLCFWIPCVMDSSYEVSHSCPVCKAHLGIVQ